jgi:sulfate adenylyltransferase
LIHVDCPLDICVKRDVKGLYQKARASAISGMTGVQDSFDSPADCDLSINSHQLSIADAVEKIVGFIHFSA